MTKYKTIGGDRPPLLGDFFLILCINITDNLIPR